MVCFSDNRPGGVGGAAHRLRPCEQAGTQTTCVPANIAGPAVGEACNARARKDQRASLQGRKRLARRKHHRACCWGSMRCLCPKRTKGRFAGTQSTCVPANTAGPALWGSMRCPCPKRPKGLLAGTQTTCGHANTAGPAVGEASDACARKDRRTG